MSLESGVIEAGSAPEMMQDLDQSILQLMLARE